MKQNELLIRRDGLEPIEDKHELDLAIEKTIEQYKQNSSQIARLTVDSVTSLAVAEARTNELENQGFIKHAFNNLTGKNKKLKSSISYSQRKAQYAAQQTLVKLAEQNLLTFDVLTAVNSKLNAYMISNSLEVNEMYAMLLQFITETRSNVLKTEHQLSHLNQKVDLLKWAQTAEYAIFNGTPYAELETASKAVCLTSDFYTISRGVWDTTDLLLIKSVLKDLGEDSNRNISFELILDQFIRDAPFRDVLQEVIRFDHVQDFSEIEIPLIYSLYKACYLIVNEKYVVQTILDNLSSLGIEKSESELTKELTLNYVRENGRRDLTLKQPIFELINELLIELKIVNNFILEEEEALSAMIDSETQLLESKKDELYEVVILDYEMDKFELTMLLNELLNIEVKEANLLLSDDRLMYRIAENLSESEAKKIAKKLSGQKVLTTINNQNEPLSIIYLDFKKIREKYTYHKELTFDRNLNSKTKFVKMEYGSIITPYSLIGGLSRNDITNKTNELFVANVHGKVKKVFNDIQGLKLNTIEETATLLPLVCCKSIKGTPLVADEINIYYSTLSGYNLKQINLNTLVIKDF